jgi:DNA polymerase III alpha subunit (gram-positive type)
MFFDRTLAFKHDARFMVMDTETEGLSLVSHRPFQLSWLICSPTEILERHNHFLLWEDLKISEEAAKITRFDWTKYRDLAKPPAEVYAEFQKHLFDPNIMPVCQNFLNFDCYMIKNLQRAIGRPVDFSYLHRSIDTKVLFIAKQKNIKYDGVSDFLGWQYKVNSIVERGLKSSQAHMLGFFEIEHDKDRLHEAMYDITMLFEIFKKMLVKFDVPDLRKTQNAPSN